MSAIENFTLTATIIAAWISHHSNRASQKMADPVSKLRLLQQLKLADMLKQVSAKGYRRQRLMPCFLLLLVSSLSGTECSFRARAPGGLNTSFVSKAKRLPYNFFFRSCLVVSGASGWATVSCFLSRFPMLLIGPLLLCGSCPDSWCL